MHYYYQTCRGAEIHVVRNLIPFNTIHTYYIQVLSYTETIISNINLYI